MRIVVYPEELAIKMAVPPTDKMAIISITNLLESDVSFPTNNSIVKIHTMKFDDELFPKGNGPKQEHFSGLKDFVDDIYGRVSILMIHCAAGMSRSPAVAEAILKYLDSDEIIYEKPDYPYKPNLLVYRYACRELGIDEE